VLLPVCVRSEVRQCLRRLVRLLVAANLSSSACGAEMVWSVPKERNPLNGAHGQMMEQRQIAPSTSEWFLIASQGDMVVRIRPGMLLGETVAGEVAFFNPSCAQLELDIAYDGSAVLSAADTYELESAGGKRTRRQSLERHRRAEIHLPHNVLQLDTDFATPAEADDTVEIRIVPLQQPIPRRGSWPSLSRPAQRPADEVTVDAFAINAGVDSQRAKRTGVRRQPTFNPAMAALVGLAALGLALLYPVLREGRQPPAMVERVPATVEAIAAPQTDPVQTTDVTIASEAQDSEVVLTTNPEPPLPLRLLELPASEATESGFAQQRAERPSEPLLEPEAAAAPRVQPNVLPPVEHGSTVASGEATGEASRQTTGQPPGVLESGMASTAIETNPDPPFVPELGDIDESAQALARRQDLLAADLALAQGRLTSPPEESAFTLYNRVLAQDPESPEARSGLQSVRQQLLNRTLAHLAGGQLDDARSALQATADAGADPDLVTDLHAEIDYRERLTDPRNQ
jgi:hypothetical protein